MAETIDRGMAPAPAPLMPPVHDGLAIASLVSAFFIPPLGIVFGHMSHHVAKQAHRVRSGIATAGLVFGYLFTAIGIIVAIVVAAAASSVPSVSVQPTAPAQTNAPAATVPTPTPTPTDTTTGPIGTTFTVTSSDGTSYDVTLDQVKQNVYPGAYETPQTAGDHFAAAQFTIKGDTGATSDDANSDANAIGSDGQEYQFSASVSTLPDFSYGQYHVSAGQSVKGWVAFELPPGVTVASVQWAPSFNGTAATWTVPVTASAQAPAAPAPAPQLTDIGSGVYVNADTSAPFALNVVSAWQASGDAASGATSDVITVYSPVTGQSYAMTYQVGGSGTVTATGGDNAYVQFQKLGLYRPPRRAPPDVAAMRSGQRPDVKAGPR
jgi:hypothetical protein